MNGNRNRNQANKRTQQSKRNRRPGVRRHPTNTSQAIVLRSVGTPNVLIAPYRYSEAPTLRFNTAIVQGAVFYRMNDMTTFFDTGGTVSVDFWAEVARMYQLCLVLSSFIEVRVQNRELVNSISVAVFPATDTSVPASATDYKTLASLPGAQRVTLQCSTGGMSTHIFKLRIKGTAMFGPDYKTDLNYCNTCVTNTSLGISPSSPTLKGYWGIAFYNASGANTLTSGGITAEVTITNRVRLSQPARNLVPDNLLLLNREPAVDREKLVDDLKLLTLRVNSL